MSIFYRLCPQDAHTCPLRACLADHGSECPAAISAPATAAATAAAPLPISNPAGLQRAGDTSDNWE